ncbi:MAG: energy-coupled thiamine transporter ThiT [Butyrivibrio sp.]|nr:energy-coupled thiamine transporter ThiT [Butyrivibrio sp.]
MYNITTLGYVSIFALILLCILSAGYYTGSSRKGISGKQMILSIACLGIAFLATNITIYQMPMGGEVTPCSMFFITYIGYLYGPRVGISAAAAYGLLQLITDPYIVNVPQMLCDYILAFGVLGISGFLSNRKLGLQLGYLAGILGRCFFSVLSGVLFFAEYAPEGMHPLIYSLRYNGTYIGAEALMTLVIISIPPVTKLLNKLKTSNGGDSADGSSIPAGR